MVGRWQGHPARAVEGSAGTFIAYAIPQPRRGGLWAGRPTNRPQAQCCLFIHTQSQYTINKAPSQE